MFMPGLSLFQSSHRTGQNRYLQGSCSGQNLQNKGVSLINFVAGYELRDPITLSCVG